MYRATRSASSVITLLTVLCAAGAGLAEEAPKLSDEQRRAVLESIERYVEEDSAIKGRFLVVDPRTSAPIALTFDHVHDAVKPEGSQYLACVDLKDARGQLYDVDVVVALEGGSPRIAEVRLHKVDGKAIAAAPK